MRLFGLRRGGGFAGCTVFRQDRRPSHGIRQQDWVACCHDKRHSTVNGLPKRSTVCGHHDPGPDVGRTRFRQLVPSPAQFLLQEPERKFKVEAARQIHGTPVNHLLALVGGSDWKPTGTRAWNPVSGHVQDHKPDHGGFDQRQGALVVLDPAPGIELRVHPLERDRPPSLTVRDAWQGRATSTCHCAVAPDFWLGRGVRRRRA